MEDATRARSKTFGPGAIVWVASSSSILILVLVVLLVTQVLGSPAKATGIEFDRMTRQMGLTCAGELLGPDPRPPKEEVATVGLCQTPSSDVVAFMTRYAPLTPDSVRAAPPTMTSEVVRWVCEIVGGGYLYASGANHGLAIRQAASPSQAYELMDALGLHPTAFSC
jgi:hypothetical protein